MQLLSFDNKSLITFLYFSDEIGWSSNQTVFCSNITQRRALVCSEQLAICITNCIDILSQYKSFLLIAGVSVDSPRGLQYLYENHSAFQVLPNYGIILGQIPTLNLIWEIIDMLPDGISPANVSNSHIFLIANISLHILT